MQNNSLKHKIYKCRPFGFDFVLLKASLTWLALFIFFLTGCQVSSHPAFAETPKPEPAKIIEEPKAKSAEPNLTETPKTVLTEPNAFEKIYELIYQGNFDAAGKLIENYRQASTVNSAEPNAQSQPAIRKAGQSQFLSELAQIVHQYQVISQQRQSAQDADYKKRLAELEKLSTVSLATPNGKNLSAQAKVVPSTSSGHVPVLNEIEESTFEETEGTDVNNVGDVNDVNNISGALLVIARACELADKQQKEELLSRPYVKQTIQKAIDKTAEYESQGKWLDAYITCYSWLQAIEPNNKEYSDYDDKLLEKASIAASFQDSPCETSEQRFQGVTKDIFLWAIAALKANYKDIIDYKQMATKAIKRCQLLGEVVGKIQNSTPQSVSAKPSQDGQNGESRSTSGVGKSFRPKAGPAWSTALAAVLAEVERSPTGFDNDEFVDVFEKVLALNAATVELSQPVLIAQFAEAAISTLDPYTVIVWPKQMQDFQKMMTNEFTGIGIEITKQKGLLTVVSLLPDTPAYNSGLDAGDVIEKVDGAETKDMTLTCAVNKITGPKGTKVMLTIKGPGEEKTKDITLTRAKITVSTVRGWQRTETGKWLYIIDEQDKIGYLQLTSFSEKTSTDLENLLRELEGNLILQKKGKMETQAEGLKGLILDLRFNSGGLLDSAVAVTDKFIKEGLIVRTEGGFGRGIAFEAAHEKNTHPNYPLVILINSGSASASEIVAGALADVKHNRALLVGERTHGKGSVQGIIYYPSGDAQLKYTMAYYHLPSGQRVESKEAMEKQGRKDWGVGPNIEVKLTSTELKKMLEVQRDNSVLVKAGHDSTKGELKKYSIEETLAADPQLAIGLLVVKCKLIEVTPRETGG